jgi:hypothetical protein
MTEEGKRKHFSREQTERVLRTLPKRFSDVIHPDACIVDVQHRPYHIKLYLWNPEDPVTTYVITLMRYRGAYKVYVYGNSRLEARYIFGNRRCDLFRDALDQLH